jgi:hypothetical protein
MTHSAVKKFRLKQLESASFWFMRFKWLVGIHISPFSLVAKGVRDKNNQQRCGFIPAWRVWKQ